MTHRESSHLDKYVNALREKGSMTILQFDAEFSPIGNVIRFALRRSNLVIEEDGRIRPRK